MHTARTSTLLLASALLAPSLTTALSLPLPASVFSSPASHSDSPCADQHAPDAPWSSVTLVYGQSSSPNDHGTVVATLDPTTTTTLPFFSTALQRLNGPDSHHTTPLSLVLGAAFWSGTSPADPELNFIVHAPACRPLSPDTLYRAIRVTYDEPSLSAVIHWHPHVVTHPADDPLSCLIVTGHVLPATFFNPPAPAAVAAPSRPLARLTNMLAGLWTQGADILSFQPVPAFDSDSNILSAAPAPHYTVGASLHTTRVADAAPHPTTADAPRSTVGHAMRFTRVQGVVTSTVVVRPTAAAAA